MSTLLETELWAQPDALARFAARAGDEAAALRPLARGVREVVLVARGSSDNAARYAGYLVPLVAGHPVAPATPSLSTVHGAPPDLRGRLVVAVSQSGGSPDVLAVLRDARAQGAPTVAVTDDPASPVAGEADHVVALDAGPERSVAATGTYTTSLAAVVALAAALADPGHGDALLADLRAVPALVGRALEQARPVADRAAAVVGTSWRGLTVGRGVDLATAHEAALKITELAGSLVVPFSPADLRHGPIAAVGPGTPTVLVAPDQPASASVLELADELGRRGAPLVTVAPGSHAVPGVHLPLPDGVPMLLSPLVAVVPTQLLAWRLAVARGVDVDAPGGLHKITRTL